jgi:predicted RNA polymerase sigma factor
MRKPSIVRDHAFHQLVARTFAEESGRIVGALMRLTGDLDLAEECAQEAFVTALETWQVRCCTMQGTQPG